VVASLPRPKGLPLDPTTGEQTPVVVQEWVIHVLAMTRPQAEQIRPLEARLAALAARVQRHSAHAKRPPSADPPWVKPHTASTPTGTPGARPGHRGHRQAWLEPTEVIAVQPPACGCGPTACPDAPPDDTHQVIEWPDLPMTVQPCVWYAARGSRCGRVTNAPVPPAASAGDGPRFTALLGELSGRQRSRRSAVQACCRSVLGVPSSQGAIQRAVDRVSEALKPHDEAIAVQARRAPVNDIDETGWDRHGVWVWLWVLVHTTVAWFKGQTSRSHIAFEALIAPWAGLLVSAGDAVYQHGVQGRHTCLAPLIRRARGLAERPEPELARCGGRVMTALSRRVHWAHAPPTAGAMQTW
jgi:transposase